MEIRLTPVRRHRYSNQQRSSFYKTECVDCDLIIQVKWEKEYVGLLPHYRREPAACCPFCQSNYLRKLKIDEKEYIEINNHWDLMEAAEAKEDNLEDWLSWCVVEDE